MFEVMVTADQSDGATLSEFSGRRLHQGVTSHRQSGLEVVVTGDSSGGNLDHVLSQEGTLGTG